MTSPALAIGVQVFDSEGNLAASSNSSSAVPTAQSVDQVPGINDGALPLNNAGDSSVIATLQPGTYTLVVTPASTNSANAVALVEVYDQGVFAQAQ